jgi:hypothetical protein
LAQRCGEGIGALADMQAGAPVAMVTHRPRGPVKDTGRKMESVQISQLSIRAHPCFRRQLAESPRFPTADSARHEALPKIHLATLFDVERRRLPKVGVREGNDSFQIEVEFGYFPSFPQLHSYP